MLGVFRWGKGWLSFLACNVSIPSAAHAHFRSSPLFKRSVAYLLPVLHIYAYPTIQSTRSVSFVGLVGLVGLSQKFLASKYSYPLECVALRRGRGGG